MKAIDTPASATQTLPAAVAAESTSADTKPGDKERAHGRLKPFTARFTFTPEEEGYVSDDDDPRVTYISDDESDWEE